MSAITQFLISHGGLVLFLIAFVEQSGVPFPAAPWLLAAGALAASGRLSPIVAICWAAVGSLAGDTIWFYVGQHRKVRVFQLFPHLHAVRQRFFMVVPARSIRRGVVMLTTAKFLPFGTVVPLHAGALDPGVLRFLLVDTFSSLFYATAYVFLGFVFHNQLEQVVVFIHKLGVMSLLLLAILAGTYAAHHFLKHRRKTVTDPNQERTKTGRKPMCSLLTNAILNLATVFLAVFESPTAVDSECSASRFRTNRMINRHRINGRGAAARNKRGKP